MRFKTIYLLHGKWGSPAGTVKKIQEKLEPLNPGVKFIRPLLPHHDPNRPAENSVELLKKLKIPERSLLIGVSLGGLAAAKLQEEYRPDLYVVCISSPTITIAGDLELKKKMSNRLAFYSTADDMISGRVEKWPQLAEAHELSWLTHDTDLHLDKLVKLIQEYIKAE